jgi:hypothetical protein
MVINFFGRQLRDMKFSFPVEGCSALQLERYAEVCGWSLARAHAQSGDAAAIGGYLGRGDASDVALGEFAVALRGSNGTGSRRPSQRLFTMERLKHSSKRAFEHE